MHQNDPHVLILGTADWNQQIATNQHYMTRELGRSYRATFVESLGLRRPELNARDVKRIISRVIGSKSKSQVNRPLAANVDVISPKIVPIHSRPWSVLNRTLLDSYFRSWKSCDNRFFWTYSPVTYGFEAFAKNSVYHCVDLYGEFPGIDSSLIDREERRLAATGIQAVGSSRVVVEHLERQGFTDVIYWPNVADTSVITAALSHQQVPRGGAVFAGNLSEKKVDFALLNRLLQNGIELHLAGPIAEGGGNSQALVNDLVSNGAHYHGALSLEALSRLMARCKVGLIPYLLTPYTKGVSPLKTYEYLAAGLSVVSTAIPGVNPDALHVHVADGGSSFVGLVQREITTPSGHGVLAARQALAEENSWVGRGKAARSLVSRLLGVSQ